MDKLRWGERSWIISASFLPILTVKQPRSGQDQAGIVIYTRSRRAYRFSMNCLIWMRREFETWEVGVSDFSSEHPCFLLNVHQLIRMTRPRRSKRSKSAQNPQELSSNSRNQIAEAPVHEARPLNTKGLPILPDELLLEIVSYYPVTPIPDRDPDVEAQNIRRQVLFALSQTSSNLRRFFLCCLWQRIEVCRSTHAAPMKNRSLALELVRQLEIVTIRDPTLAEYVQYVSHLSKLKFN